MQTKTIEIDFDLDRALDAVVSIQTRIPENALTASVLGTERAGHGVVIDGDGLIVTIGYLVAEAETVLIGGQHDTFVGGYVVGYDYDTGFGLVKPTTPLRAPAMDLGSSAELSIADPVIVAGHGGTEHATAARVAAKREFAGYWEYVLEEAIFTVPAHPNWGGTALIDMAGRLCGVGSLLIQEPQGKADAQSANMFVPIDLLPPILDDLCRFGAPGGPPRPWLGFLVQDIEDELIISGVYTNCPADNAGLRPGDVVLEVNGQPVSQLAELFRCIWRSGSAGVEVRFKVQRDTEIIDRTVKSVDRNMCLRSGVLH